MSTGVSNVGNSENLDKCEENGCSEGKILFTRKLPIFSWFGDGSLEEEGTRVRVRVRERVSQSPEKS